MSFFGRLGQRNHHIKEQLPSILWPCKYLMCSGGDTLTLPSPSFVVGNDSHVASLEEVPLLLLPRGECS